MCLICNSLTDQNETTVQHTCRRFCVQKRKEYVVTTVNILIPAIINKRKIDKFSNIVDKETEALMKSSEQIQGAQPEMSMK